MTEPGSPAAPNAPLVGVIAGSDSDLPQLQGCFDGLNELGIAHEVRILSAHRTPDAVDDLFADGGPYRVVIAAAGGAAHLAGAIAARTTVPVIGIPLVMPPFQGLDALLATVQMPPGIPVATVSCGAWGAANAALLAAEILGVADADLAERIRARRAALRDKVLQKDAVLRVRARAPREG
jgi:phosphoribosylaminoimidazole carboxylase PurE protein